MYEFWKSVGRAFAPSSDDMIRVVCMEVPVVDVEVRHFSSKPGWHGAEAFGLAELVDLLYHFDGESGFGVF